MVLYLNSIVSSGKKLSGQSWIVYFVMKMMSPQALLTQLLFLNTGLNSSSLSRQFIWRETSALQMVMLSMMPGILAGKNLPIFPTFAVRAENPKIFCSIKNKPYLGTMLLMLIFVDWSASYCCAP